MERRVLVLGLALIGSGACVTLLSRPDRLRYSHSLHLKEDVACVDCHAGIEETTKLDVTYIPTHDACARCHSAEEMERCTYCHSNPEHATRSPPRRRGIRFSHAVHMEPAKGNCVRCHQDVPDAESVEETNTPAMETCAEDCHRPDMKRFACDRCHVSLSRYPLESIRFFAHGVDFERRHGRVARGEAEACMQCHERSYCMDCHSGTRVLPAEAIHVERASRAFIHPAPYAALHAVDARTRKTRCETCHATSFCSSCHATYGVAALEGLRTGPHPSGWLDPVSPNFHGMEARRRIATCAACHDRGAASVCVRCHQVGGPGGNPHPPGFARGPQPRDHRMCRACHWR